AGWTGYAPLSTSSPGHGVDFYVAGLQIAGAGTLMGGINFLVTVVNMRAPGMTYMRMPLFTWTSFIASVLILFAFPALTVGLFLFLFHFRRWLLACFYSCLTACSVPHFLMYR